MSWQRAFWRWDVIAERVGPRRLRAPRHAEPDTDSAWQNRLEAAGLPCEWAERLAPPLRAKHAALGSGSADALLAGAIEAHVVHADAGQLQRPMHKARDLERLLKAFNGELEKLDEVLEVLAAYAQRMRGRPGSQSDRILH